MREAVSVGEHQRVVGIESDRLLLTVYIAELGEGPQKLPVLDCGLIQVAAARGDESIERVRHQVGERCYSERKIGIRNLVDVAGAGKRKLDSVIPDVLRFDNVIVGHCILQAESPVLDVGTAPLVLDGVDVEADIG